MSARYDIEGLVADTVKAYLQAQLTAGIQATAPVVTFYDPMSVDDANRIIVMIPAGESHDYAAGNFQLSLEIGIKSQWTEATQATDWASHMSRVTAVRNVVWDTDFSTGLHTQANSTIGFNTAQPDRRINTEVRQNWFYTPTVVALEVYTIATA